MLLIFPIIKTEIRYENYVVLVRNRTRQIAQLLGFNEVDMTKLSTAVSEIARNAYMYGNGGVAEFSIIGDNIPQTFLVKITDNGSGIEDLEMILSGNYKSKTGMGQGILGAKKLVDFFDIKTDKNGTVVSLGKLILHRERTFSAKDVELITNKIMTEKAKSAFEEIQFQNQELLKAFSEIQKKNEELETKNKGILALYKELEEKNKELKQFYAQKIKFFSLVSHEFRTPLNSIISLSRILLDKFDGELTLEQEKQVSLIKKSAESLLSLINEFLNLAKLEEGKIEIKKTCFSLTQFTTLLESMMKPLLVDKKAVNLIFEHPEEIEIKTDEEKLFIILRNLISNAIKFTDEGEVRVRTKVDGNFIEFTVSDTGIGMPKDKLDDIFKEYTQLKTKDMEKGFGLGLSITKKLVELLGGEVSVISEEKKGSTFSVKIPIR